MNIELSIKGENISNNTYSQKFIIHNTKYLMLFLILP